MAKPPKGKNGLGAKAMHAQRRRYVRQGYPLLNESSAIDLWYGPKSLYGRINQRSEPQMISETNLKNFLSAPDIVAADFVVDAFEDLRQYMIQANRLGKVNVSNSFIGLFTPSKGWQSPREEFYNNLVDVYQPFVTVYLENTNNHHHIKGFKDFIKYFLEYSLTIAEVAPITLSGVVTSRFVPPNISGLVVEISDISHDDDHEKFNRYLSDSNFLFYQNAARKHGFRVDRNAPWRLVADVSSAEMKEYMSEYGINSVEDLFDIYYYNAHRLDVSLLKENLIQMYNDYVIGNQYAKVNIPGSSDNPGVRSHIITRNTVSEQEVDALYGNYYWLKFYFHIRSTELGIKWARKAEDKKLREMKNVLDFLDFPRALDYIVDEMFKNS